MLQRWFHWSILFAFLILTGCKTTDTAAPDTPNNARSELVEMFRTSQTFSDNFTGFMLYDPQTGETIYAQNEKRYFTPASNTKLFTFYTGLKLLPDQLPALKYTERGDSLIFWGTGDPSFLRADLDDQTVFNFLKNSDKKLFYSDSHYRDEGLGPGWSWSDYQYAYSAEKSPFPMYGNMVQFQLKKVSRTTLVRNDSALQINPPYFRKMLNDKPDSTSQNNQPVLSRGFDDNIFRYAPESETTSFTVEKPYHYTPELITEMLSDTLNKSVKYVDVTMPKNVQTLYSVSADTVYKHMLQPSDNFIAEQLLLAAAAEQGQPLNSDGIIEQMKSTYLSAMPDEPQWVDGSGLSRYNLFSPRSMIWLLGKIDDEFTTDENLFELLAAGGESGTIRNWYAARDGAPPYVFAKTGTLSNNHCLTGFLITESGRKLYFSFMNNHYVTSSSVVKEAMEKVLWYIHENY